MSNPQPPRWAVRAAHLAALTTLPSCIWRLALAAGFDLGYHPAWIAENASSVGDRAYLVVLSLLTEGLALLTLGLVSPWGERLPAWIPVLGGRRVPPKAAVVPASIGSVALLLLWSPNPLMFTDLFYDPLEPQGGWQILMGSVYLPLVLWGPLLAAVTLAYHRRTVAGHEPVLEEPGTRIGGQ
ncbi:hypothetical protein [Kribbella sp. NPDC049227]|uniref:hypothetical protein n=1 Tax=Kribbella sp. NPDC049227 TaxID=3364113 RepID=UPI00371026CD